MKNDRMKRRRRLAFTLVELMVVLAIISLLVVAGLPNFSAMMLKARSVQCAGNLRTIGMAASEAATDNNNQYPEIDQAAAQIYTPPAPNLTTALGPYGVITNTVQCPVDMAVPAATCAFKLYGSSYEWDPIFDNEPVNETMIYSPPTVQGGRLTGNLNGNSMALPINSSRVRLAMDFNAVHKGHRNVVYGDGHVASH